jgi:hypothetical protein
MNKETHENSLKIINVINVKNNVLALILDCTRQSIYNKKYNKVGCYFNANDLQKLQSYLTSFKQRLNNLQ